MLGKPKFEVSAVKEAVPGDKVNMFEVTATIRSGARGRPRKIRFVVFGKDALEAYQRGMSVLQERTKDASVGSGVLRGD